MYKELQLVALPNLALSNPKMYYNIGLLTLASVAEREGYKVEVLDWRAGKPNKPIRIVSMVGFSCTTPEITAAKELSMQLRSLKVYTFVGGAHPTLNPDDCLPYFDCVVMGEGESILPFLLNTKPKGVLAASRINNLDLIPLPSWDLISDPFSDTLLPGEKYGKGNQGATLIASRGCPYNCSFCGNMLKTPVIWRSVSSVELELQALLLKGIRDVRFEDDNFTLNPHLGRMCDMLRGLFISYKCHTRSNLINPVIAKMLAHSGCVECCVGVESADDKVLKINHKGVTRKQHAEAIKIIQDAGMIAKTYWMSGLPGETEESVELAMSFMDEVKPDKWTISCFTPYPGCDIYKNPSKYGVRIVDTDWSHWWNFVDHYVYELKDASQEVLWDRYKRLYEYFRGKNLK